MAHKLLSISRQQDRIRGIFIEKKGGGYFAGDPMDLSSMEALHSACRSADEIYINDSFSSAICVWSIFPKLTKRNLANLLYQEALEQLSTREDVHVEFNQIEDVKENGTLKTKISYIAIKEEEILEIWKLFKGFTGKIKGITSLPVSLSHTIARQDSPDSNFIVTWIGPSEAMIVISSPEGFVKVARNFSFDTRCLINANRTDLQEFSTKLEREFNRTIIFFKQEFREPEPRICYFLGNRHLKSMFDASPLQTNGLDCRYTLSSPLINNYTNEDENENIHITSSIILPGKLNFLPLKTVLDKKINRYFYPAGVVLAASIAFFVFWNFQVKQEIAKANDRLMKQYEIAKVLKTEVNELAQEIEKFSPFQGWKVFYDQTFNYKLPWDQLFSDLGAQTPPNIILDSFTMNQVVKPLNKTVKDKWYATISGEVKASNWKNGLKDLRDFGAEIETSNFYKVSNINYVPQRLDDTSKSFKFELGLELKHMEI